MHQANKPVVRTSPLDNYFQTNDRKLIPPSDDILDDGSGVQAAPVPPIARLDKIGRANDVIFHRTVLKHEGQIPSGDSVAFFDRLIAALRLREKHMAQSLQSFPEITTRFLKYIETGGPLDEILKQAAAAGRRADDDETHKVFVEEAPPHIADYWNIQLQPSNGYSVKMEKGIVQIFDETSKLKEYPYPILKEHVAELTTFCNLVNDGPLRTFANKRLNILSSMYDIHVNQNEMLELFEQRTVPNRDFYNVLKVDTHIHAAGCPTPVQLLNCIREKAKTDGDQPVLPGAAKGDPPQTLSQLFKSLDLDPESLSVFSLDVQSDRDTMNRFDRFDSKYNPAGNAGLRKVFLKSDNLVYGKYFAELINENIRNYEHGKYVYAELRKSVGGKNLSEWVQVAKWVIDNNVISDSIRWVIQVPRAYDAYRKSGTIQSFEEMMRNVFVPLAEATIDPQGHPEIAKLLEYVISFDSVSDESKPENPIPELDVPSADQWTTDEEPTYAYYIYYMHANLSILNQLRKERGMNTFTLRPHCGEAGSPLHLATSFILAENISHGISLTENPALQYLYYLAQIPIAMSPLSNNALFLPLNKHPLRDFLARGLVVTVSTDDPLMFHSTAEPLLEEYAVSSSVFNLSNVDKCELARNSVLMSGFPENVKEFWLGKNYDEPGVAGNYMNKTNVPDIRVAFRLETLGAELYNICVGTSFAQT